MHLEKGSIILYSVFVVMGFLFGKEFWYAGLGLALFDYIRLTYKD